MKAKMFFAIVLIAHMQVHELYASAPAPVVTIDLCKTDTAYPSSIMVRQWALHILKSAGYSNPQDITIINAPSQISAANPCVHQACAYAQTKRIHFNEAHFALYPLGVTLATVAHEAIHIKQNDYQPNCANRQDCERYADTQGVVLGKCESCALETAQYYLNMFHRETPAIAKDAMISMPKTISQITTLTWQHYPQALDFSKRSGSTHPCGYERACYLIMASQNEPIKGNMCVFHQASNSEKKAHENVAQAKKVKGIEKRTLADANITTPVDDKQPEKKQKKLNVN